MALAIGGTVHIDRTVDFVLKKPWHEVYSRKTLAPNAGGVNGRTTLATREMGDDILNRILPILVNKLKVIVAGTD